MTSPGTPVPLHGGSWSSDPRGCRSARRVRVGLDDVSYLVGFRVIHLPQEVEPLRMSLRGGFSEFTVRSCRSAYRYRFRPDHDNGICGFRVVCLPQEFPARSSRGGCWERSNSWGGGPRYSRSSCRVYDHPGNADDITGFRVVCLAASGLSSDTSPPAKTSEGFG